LWTELGQTVTGNPNISSCGSSSVSSSDCAKALSQLAVTGRHAFNSFSSWDLFAGAPPGSTGPQANELISLAHSPYTTEATLPSGFVSTIPPIPSSFTDAQLQTAASTVILQAYTALWAIRANDLTWRQYRSSAAGWIAVSGEDDTPHRPVNVASTPFPQFDIDVPVTVQGQPFKLTTRYMLASQSDPVSNPLPCAVCGQHPAPTAAPAIPTVLACAQTEGKTPVKCNPRLTFPVPAVPVLGTQDYPPVYIIYIHGGGSRLEEADGMAAQLISQNPIHFGGPLPPLGKRTLVVISFDLPNSAYADQSLVPANGGSRMPLDASSSSFENGPNGTPPANINAFPVLNFTINFINSFINALAQNKILDPTNIVAVVGGSLGGNTSLILRMNPMPAPFTLNSPLSFPQAATVSWSPTSMVSYSSLENAVVVDGNMCCIPTKGPNPTWQSEKDNPRASYFYNLYFTNTAPAFLGGLPPDPEMWYRDDWADTNNVHDCKASFIVQSRYDRYEVYSSLMRLWTTAVDTEQATFSFQTNTSSTSWIPQYSFIGGRVLLAAGACDDYDNALSGLLWGPWQGDALAVMTGGVVSPISGYFSSALLPPASAISTGTCNNNAIGNTGASAASHQDIYGYTHDVATDMRRTSGKTLFLNDTGHSIHDERPVFFAGQILKFLSNADNNVTITLGTGNDDARWNSEVHAIIGSFQTPLPQPPNLPAENWFVDMPLNYWFHPWPAAPLNGPLLQPLGDPDNPCGAASGKIPTLNCTKLNTFDLEQNSIHTFTIALPDQAAQAPMNLFSIEFISGWNITPPGNVGYGNDKWVLASIAACLSGHTAPFVSDSSSPTSATVANSFQANNFGLPGLFWQPPSFKGPQDLVSFEKTCQFVPSNPSPPPNAAASAFF
jgi:pimeloyl-ACP methyl ester carboxylesterase